MSIFTMSLNETVPTGVDPHYYHQSKVASILIMSIVYAIVVIVAVALRIAARRMSRARLWVDDWIAVVALLSTCSTSIWIFNLAFIFPAFFTTRRGWGRHDVVLANSGQQFIAQSLIDMYTTYYFYIIAMAAFKCSAIALYYRLSSIERWLRIARWTLGSLIVSWTLAVIGVYAFRCQPLSAGWTFQGTCVVDLRTVYLMNSIPAIIFSFLTLVLPIRLVLNLHLPILHKAALLIVFVLGGGDLAISGVRLQQVYADKHDDPTYNDVDLCYWSTSEVALGLVFCCLVTYAPLLRHFFSRISSTFASKPSVASKRMTDREVQTIGANKNRKMQQSEYSNSFDSKSETELIEIHSPPSQMSV